ncbi:ChbG/HpnK family deacetylase [candidate division KSB1 bacterium]|nr:ChbG/HpnK family deacetylase [candidate division KSB1 bacterium]
MKFFTIFSIIFYALCIAVFIFFFLFLSQMNREIRLIVRGDDMGFCHSVNLGCIQSYQDGIMTAVEVMVPSPYFLEAAEMLNNNPGLDVGIHLTLNSEWEKIKWGPVTNAPSLVDENGYFFQMVWPDEAYPPEKALGTSAWQLNEIEKELRAQIETALQHIPHCTHITPHMGFHTISPRVSGLVLKLAKEYNVDANIRMIPLRSLDLFGYALSAEERTAAAVHVLEKIWKGTWECYDHPGLDTPEMRNVWHIGDEDVAFSRDAVTKAFTSDKVKEIIKRRNIKLIGYKDLKIWN